MHNRRGMNDATKRDVPNGTQRSVMMGAFAVVALAL
jgi:hypothetical protein